LDFALGKDRPRIAVAGGCFDPAANRLGLGR
jgi:hypothetical protein